MTRIYDAQSLVDLPRFDAASAAAVGTALAAAAAGEKKLAANVSAGLVHVTTAVTALKSTFVDGLGGAPDALVQPALRAEATAWSGIENWLDGLTRVGAPAKMAAAEKLLAALYPDGLRFLRAAAAKRWTETEARLQRIAKDNLGADFALLGGTEMLEQLQAAHDATGVAAGITVAKAAVETPPVGKGLDTLKTALRTYVLQVVANAALVPSDEATALAERLLKPLTAFATPEAQKAAPGPNVPPAPAPAASAVA